MSPHCYYFYYKTVFETIFGRNQNQNRRPYKFLGRLTVHTQILKEDMDLGGGVIIIVPNFLSLSLKKKEEKKGWVGRGGSTIYINLLWRVSLAVVQSCLSLYSTQEHFEELRSFS